MKILHIGFGGFTPNLQSGLIDYTRNLALEQIKSGHQVAYFYSGNYDFKIKPYLKIKKHLKIELAELINSPLLYSDSGNLKDQISNVIIEKIFSKYLDQFQPDIIHLQNLAGLPVSLIQIASSKKYPLITTLHNSWFICPRVELIKKDGQICPAPQTNNYSFCSLCIKKNSPLKNLIEKTSWGLVHNLPPYLFSLLRHLPPISPISPVKEIPQITRLFQKRRQTFLSLLQQIPRIIADSSLVKQIHLDYGLKSKILVENLPCPATEFIKSPLSPKSSGSSSSLLVFAYLGRLRPEKGPAILIEAFKKLKIPEVKLVIFGQGLPDFENQLKESARGYNIEFKGAFQYDKLQKLLTEVDLGIVPSLLYEGGPLTISEFLSAGIPVIASNTCGAAFDLLKNSGLIFESGNIEDLKNKMKIIIDDKQIIYKWKKNIPKLKTMKDHAKIIEKMYFQICK